MDQQAIGRLYHNPGESIRSTTNSMQLPPSPAIHAMLAGNHNNSKNSTAAAAQLSLLATAPPASPPIPAALFATKRPPARSSLPPAKRFRLNSDADQNNSNNAALLERIMAMQGGVPMPKAWKGPGVLQKQQQQQPLVTNNTTPSQQLERINKLAGGFKLPSTSGKSLKFSLEEYQSLWSSVPPELRDEVLARRLERSVLREQKATIAVAAAAATKAI